MFVKFKPLLQLLQNSDLHISVQNGKLKLQRTSNCTRSEKELFREIVCDSNYLDNCVVCSSSTLRFLNLHEGYDFVCEKCARKFYNTKEGRYFKKLKQRYVNCQLKMLARKYIMLQELIKREFGEENITWSEGIDLKFMRSYLKEPIKTCRVCQRPINYRGNYCNDHRTVGKHYVTTLRCFTENNSQNFEIVSELRAQRITKFRCKRCGYIFEAYYKGKTHLLKCPSCDTKYVSETEKKFRDFVQEFCPYELKFNEHFRTKNTFYELDVFVPELKLGIEFNGAYFHSELFKDKYAHYKKWLFFRYKHNINIVAIWDFEFKDPVKLKIWESKLKLWFGLKKDFELVDARACKIEPITWQQAQMFLEHAHLDGSGRKTNLCFGLYYNDELLQVLTLAPQFLGVANSSVIEISRFATKSFVLVRGGFLKMLNFALKNIDAREKYAKLITYSENRYSWGQTYNKFFVFDGHVKPGFVYYDMRAQITLNRLQSLKHKHIEQQCLKLYDYGKAKYMTFIR